jgi:hypothetical protein
MRQQEQMIRGQKQIERRLAALEKKDDGAQAR